MAHFKRRRCRRQVRCTLCTDVRWLGNRAGRFKTANAKRVLKKNQKEQEEP